MLNCSCKKNSFKIETMSQKFIGKLVWLFIVSNNFPASLAEVPLSSFFPYTSHEGAIGHAFGDETEIPIQLRSPIKFLNRTFWHVNVQSNGWISLRDSGNNHRERICSLCADGVPDSGSTLTTYQTTDEASSAMQNAKKEITSTFRNLKGIRFNFLFVATWYLLRGYNFPSHNRNTFQLIIVTDHTRSHTFALFYYNKIEWGSPSAEFRNELDVVRYRLPVNAQNITIPGKWIYKVDTNILAETSCEYTGLTGSSLSIDPKVISVWGNMLVNLEGICLQNPNVTVKCNFRDPSKPRPLQTTGITVYNTLMCPVPILHSLGTMMIDVKVTYPFEPTIIYEGQVQVIRESESSLSSQPKIFLNETLDKSFLVNAYWDPSAMTIGEVAKTLNEEDPCHKNDTLQFVQVTLLEYDGYTWKELGYLTPPFVNNGVIVTTLNMTRYQELIGKKKRVLMRNLALKTTVPLSTGETLVKMVPSNIATGMMTLQKLESHSKYNVSCKSWYEKESAPPTDVISCPIHINQAKYDWRFMVDTSDGLSEETSNVSATFIQGVPSLSGASSRCVYDNEGKLNIRHSMLYRWSPTGLQDYWSHYWNDKLPYVFCSLAGDKELIDFYHKKRPLMTNGNYEFPLTARAIGQGHMTSFSGVNYTFMASGEYVMILYSSDQDLDSYAHETTSNFRMHLGIGEVHITEDDETILAFLMAAMEQKVGGDIIHVVAYVSTSEDVLCLVADKITLKLDQFKSNLYYPGLVISHQSNYEVILNFATGFSFKIQGEPKTGAINIVSMADPKLHKTIDGFWGNVAKISNESVSDNYDFGLTWKVDEDESLLKKEREHFDLTTMFSSDPVQASWYLNITNQTVLNASLTSNHDFCDGDNECEFDYDIFENIFYAEGTKAANLVFQEITEARKLKIKRCPEFSPAENLMYSMDNYFIDSLLHLECLEKYEIYPGVTSVTYKCEEDKNGEASWISPTYGKLEGRLACKRLEVKGNSSSSGTIPTITTALPVDHKKMIATTEHMVDTPPLTEIPAPSSSGLTITIIILIILVLGLVGALAYEYRGWFRLNPFRWRGQLTSLL